VPRLHRDDPAPLELPAAGASVGQEEVGDLLHGRVDRADERQPHHVPLNEPPRRAAEQVADEDPDDVDQQDRQPDAEQPDAERVLVEDLPNPAGGLVGGAGQEVGVLKRLIEARALDADPLRGLARSFFAAIQDFLAAPWAVAESDFIYEKTRGQCPNDFYKRVNFNSALQRVAKDDATVHQIMIEVNHLVKPFSALRDPQIVSRVTARMATCA